MGTAEGQLADLPPQFHSARPPLAGRGAPCRDGHRGPAADLIRRIACVPLAPPHLAADLQQPAEADDNALFEARLDDEGERVELVVRIDGNVEPGLTKVVMTLRPGGRRGRKDLPGALFAFGHQEPGRFGGFVHQLRYAVQVGPAQPADPRNAGAFPHLLLGKLDPVYVDVYVRLIFVHQPLQSHSFGMSLRGDDPAKVP